MKKTVFADWLRKNAKAWKGETIDYHVGLDKKCQDDDFESPCAVCKKPVYYHDFTASKEYVHLGQCFETVAKENEKRG